MLKSLGCSELEYKEKVKTVPGLLVILLHHREYLEGDVDNT
jgi:hypothetical protein